MSLSLPVTDKTHTHFMVAERVLQTMGHRIKKLFPKLYIPTPSLVEKYSGEMGVNSQSRSRWKTRLKQIDFKSHDK